MATPYFIHTLKLGPMDNFVYLIEDKASQRTAVVDPAWDVAAIRALAERRRVTITDILLTHSHNDHINGISDVLAVYDAQIHLLRAEYQFWQNTLYSPTLYRGGDSIRLGQTTIKVLHTPGHTPGSACFQLGDDLITGDTLFVFGCGHCDLAGSSPTVLFHTLNKMKATLPGNTMIYPGHDYGCQATSTLQAQIEGNPFLHFKTVQSFAHYRMVEHRLSRKPPYHPISSVA